MNQIQTTVQGYLINTRGPWQVTKSQMAIHNLVAWRDSFAGQPDYWLRELICHAFQRMIARRMQDAPASDLITAAAEDWVDIIGEHLEEDLDKDRIIIAFKTIFRECRKWPQPAELLKRMPTRIRKSAPSTVVEAPISDEAHARGTAVFNDILSTFK